MRFLLTAKEGPFSRNPGLLALTRLRASVTSTDEPKPSWIRMPKNIRILNLSSPIRSAKFSGKRQSRKLISEIKFPETRPFGGFQVWGLFPPIDRPPKVPGHVQLLALLRGEANSESHDLDRRSGNDSAPDLDQLRFRAFGQTWNLLRCFRLERWPFLALGGRCPKRRRRRHS